MAATIRANRCGWWPTLRSRLLHGAKWTEWWAVVKLVCAGAQCIIPNQPVTE
jgi:hypothetical protein